MKPDMNKTKSQGTAVDLIGGPIMKKRSRWETASVLLCPERTGQEMRASFASLWPARF